MSSTAIRQLVPINRLLCLFSQFMVQFNFQYSGINHRQTVCLNYRQSLKCDRNLIKQTMMGNFSLIFLIMIMIIFNNWLRNMTIFWFNVYENALDVYISFFISFIFTTKLFNFKNQYITRPEILYYSDISSIDFCSINRKIK